MLYTVKILSKLLQSRQCWTAQGHDQRDRAEKLERKGWADYSAIYGWNKYYEKAVWGGQGLFSSRGTVTGQGRNSKQEPGEER